MYMYAWCKADTDLQCDISHVRGVWSPENVTFAEMYFVHGIRETRGNC